MGVAIVSVETQSQQSHGRRETMITFGGSGLRLMGWSHMQKKSGFHRSNSGQVVNEPFLILDTRFLLWVMKIFSEINTSHFVFLLPFRLDVFVPTNPLYDAGIRFREGAFGALFRVVTLGVCTKPLRWID